MTEFLFGWVTRPRYLVSFLDVATASVELILVVLVGIIIALIYEKIYKRSHEYNIRTQRWEKK